MACLEELTSSLKYVSFTNYDKFGAVGGLAFLSGGLEPDALIITCTDVQFLYREPLLMFCTNKRS